jgi:hypothetical protein
MPQLQHDPAHERHEHQRDADDVEDIDPKQVTARRPAPRDQEFLQAKQESQPEDLRPAHESFSRDGARGRSLPGQLVDDQRERNSRQEQKQRRRQGPS